MSNATSDEIRNARLSNPQYRGGYAAGYADAMNEILRECKARLDGTPVLSDLSYHAASCLEDVAELLDNIESFGQNTDLLNDPATDSRVGNRTPFVEE